MKHHSIYVALLVGAALATTIQAQELAADKLPPAAAAMPAAKPDPVAAAARVTKALQTDQDVPAGEITVFTHAGTVVMTGGVNTESQKVAAGKVAEKAAEGARISNNIEVRPMADRPVKDQQAAQQSALVVRDVESALHADTRTSNLGIAVTSADGRTVVLQGLVPTHADRTIVQSVAGKVKGVTQIDNRVTVPAN